MLRFYFLSIGLLIASSFIPFLAFITVPLIYLVTLIFFPIFTYRILCAKSKLIRITTSVSVFLFIYLPLLWGLIPAYIDHSIKCSSSEVGVHIRYPLEMWHRLKPYPEEGLRKWRMPLRNISGGIWKEGDKKVYQDKYGNISKTWQSNGVRYRQFLDAFRLEESRQAHYFTTKYIYKIVSTQDNKTLVEMVNYSRNDTIGRPFIKKGILLIHDGSRSCNASIYKTNNNPPVQINHWKLRYDYLMMLYGTPEENWIH